MVLVGGRTGRRNPFEPLAFFVFLQLRIWRRWGPWKALGHEPQGFGKLSDQGLTPSTFFANLNPSQTGPRAPPLED